MKTEKTTISSRFLRRATEFIWPFGAFQKTTDPHSAIENLERASAAATLWILVGILIDIVALFLFSHDMGERIVGVIANGLIGLGLAAEYLVIGKVIDATKEAERESNERVARIEQQAAEANARAAEAELRTEKLKLELSWRRISPAEAETISATLHNGPPCFVMITYFGADPEATTFAHDIGLVFSRNGWQVGFTGASFSGPVTFGLIIAQPSSVADVPACAAARTAITNAGIEYRGGFIPPWFMGTGSGQNVSSPCAQIYVGPKPIPEFA